MYRRNLKLIKEEFRMVIQEKVQNRSLKMTRENLIFAKTIGTLYTIGADRNVISQMVEETKNTETDILPISAGSSHVDEKRLSAGNKGT